MTLGERIRNKRLERGLSQKELGQILNVSQQMIGQYEQKSETLKPATIKKIANALEISEQELLGYTDQSYRLYKAMEDAEDDEKNDALVIGGILVSQKNLLRQYNALNSIGKAEAIKRVSELKHIPGFTGPDDTPFD